MGKLYIPENKRIKGPWLLGTNELEELDEVIEYIRIKLSESVDIEIKESANKGLQDGTYQNLETAISILKKKRKLDEVINVTLFSGDNKRLVDSSLSGILKDSKLNNFKPTVLELHINKYYGNNSFSLKIGGFLNSGIEYEVNCYDQDCRDEINYKLNNWLEKYQPNKLKQIWNEYAYFLLFLCICFLIMIVPFTYSNELPDFKTIYKNDINKIINSGVNKNNETEAIELLLKYNIDYKPNNIKEVIIFNKNAIKIISFLIFIIIISSIKPRTTIGIGKKKTILKFYRSYMKFILITLPTIFIIPLIFEYIKKLMGF